MPAPLASHQPKHPTAPGTPQCPKHCFPEGLRRQKRDQAEALARDPALATRSEMHSSVDDDDDEILALGTFPPKKLEWDTPQG